MHIFTTELVAGFETGLLVSVTDSRVFCVYCPLGYRRSALHQGKCLLLPLTSTLRVGVLAVCVLGDGAG